MPSTQTGTLVIVVFRARHLEDKHRFSKQSPYAKLSLSGETESTKVDKRGGQHPEWDDELRFPIYGESEKANRLLELSCWAKEGRKDYLIGEATVDITESLKKGEYDIWVPLSKNGKQRGEIYLEMTFYSSRPPMVRQPSRHPDTPSLTGALSIINPAAQAAAHALPPLSTAGWFNFTNFFQRWGATASEAAATATEATLEASTQVAKSLPLPPVFRPDPAWVDTMTNALHGFGGTAGLAVARVVTGFFGWGSRKK